MTETSTYAWIIDKDHLYAGQDYLRQEAGTIGPRDANGSTKQELAANYPQHHQFRMYDDDGILYYTGTLYWDDEGEPLEEYTYGPLFDYGAPNAGAVVIKYTDRPGWECG